MICFLEQEDYLESRSIRCSIAFLIYRLTGSLARSAAGITEQTATWNDWKKLGYEVVHGSKALFGCDLIWGSLRKFFFLSKICLRSFSVI